MKRFNLIALLLLSSATAQIAADCCRTECPPDNSCDVEYTSRSFLATRPAFLSASPEMISGFRSDRLHFRQDGLHGTAEAVIFGNKSTDDRSLARYFFMNGKTDLIAADVSSNDFPPQPYDLFTRHFNIRTRLSTFRSQISIRPETSQAGVGLMVRKAFCVNEEKGRGFFTSLSAPIMKVRNNLNFQETIINNGGGVRFTTGAVETNPYWVANMTEAFQQAAFQFGKISPFAMTETGVADIEWKVGYEWIQQEPFHLESYLGLLIPTGNKPNAEYLFQPIVGQGHHWGIIYGSAVGIHIWENSDASKTLRVEYALHSQYLFKNTQCRSLDLMCKPWSRYIELYSDVDQAIVALTLASDVDRELFKSNGINLLTTDVKVRPGFSFNMTMAGIYDTGNWSLEAGYNLYYRQTECLKLACPWQEGPAIKYINGEGFTNPVRDITGNRLLEFAPEISNSKTALIDYKFNVLTEQDLNLNSAASPSILTYTLYGSAGYNWSDREYPLFANLGGSYEFSSSNAAIERWTIWAKMGLSF